MYTVEEVATLQHQNKRKPVAGDPRGEETPASRPAGPQLVRTHAAIHNDASHSPLALWHLLSLDAPTVSTLWTVFLARCAGVHLPVTTPVAMFLAVWILYAADRLLDARPLHDGASPPDLEERHRFHHRHRSTFLLLIASTAIVLGWLLHWLDPVALYLYAALATLLAAWLLLVHARPVPQSLRLPKELAVGIFFSAAVFIPTLARMPALRLALLPDALLAAAACTLNCLYLYAWEHPSVAHTHVDNGTASAHPTTLWSIRHLPQLSLACALAAGMTALGAALHGLPSYRAVPGLPAAAAALTAVALLLLHIIRKPLSPVHLRAAADLALLTPALMLFVPQR